MSKKPSPPTPPEGAKRVEDAAPFTHPLPQTGGSYVNEGGVLRRLDDDEPAGETVKETTP